MNRTRRALYATYCKLTCAGGSECGTCACISPADCEMQNDRDFQVARGLAVSTMVGLMRKDLRPKKFTTLWRNTLFVLAGVVAGALAGGGIYWLAS